MFLLTTILIILIIFYAFYVQPRYNRNRNGYTSKRCMCGCQEGIFSAKKANITKGDNCPLLKSSYKSLLGSVSKTDKAGFSNDSSGNSLKTLCNMGNSIMAKCSTNQTYTKTPSIGDPMKDHDFVRLCCNGENKSKCNMGSDCIINKAKLSEISRELSSTSNTESYTNSTSEGGNKFSKYCSLGTKIINNKCTIDDLHPQKDPVFKKYCCNGSDNMDMCKTEIVDRCLVPTSKFVNKSRDISNWGDATILNDTSMETVKNFCKLGNYIMENKCNTGDASASINPMNDAYFKKYCCNGSSDRAQCNPSNINCASDKAKFIEKSLRLNYTDSMFTNQSNIDSVTDFCKLGLNGCERINPTSDPLFRKYCCNGSSDRSRCNSSNVTDCIGNKAKFMELDKTISSLNPGSISSNKNLTDQYCSIAKLLLDKGCSGITPSTYKNYKLYCTTV